jgi:phage-related protein (TIGR01555 family)
MATKKAEKKTRSDSAPVRRSDGWNSALTGIGLASRDKRLSTGYDPDVITRKQAEDLWRGDDMAARIVEVWPDEMMRQGFTVKIQPKETDVTEPTDLGGDDGTTDEDIQSDDNPDGEDDTPLADETDAETETDKPTPPVDDKKPAPFTKKDAFGFGGPPAPAAPKAPPGVIKKKDDDTQKTSEATMAKLEELRVYERFHEGLCYERAYGGAGILLGVDDGQDPRKPLNLDTIKTIGWLTVLTPRELVPVSWYADPRAPRYGEPEIYRITPESSPTSTTKATPGAQANTTGVSVEVHESRVLVFRGARVSRSQVLTNQGWGDSVFVRCQHVLRDFQMTWSSAALLMYDFSQAVIKIKDLAGLIADNDDATVLRRAQAIEMSRSVARMVMIDSEEDYSRQATPLSGMHEMLDKFNTRLAAAADMPLTLLMGQSPGGLNATGDSDVRFFYDRVKAKQNTKLRPPLERLIKLVFLSVDGPTGGEEPENWSVDFKPLWQMSDTEQADIRVKQAGVDQIYVNIGAVTPEEIAASRFGGDAYSTETVIDFEGRQEMATQHEADKQAAAENAAKALEDAKKNPPPPGAPPPFGGHPAAPPPHGPPGAPPPVTPPTGEVPGDIKKDSWEDQDRDEAGKWAGEGGGGGATGPVTVQHQSPGGSHGPGFSIPPPPPGFHESHSNPAVTHPKDAVKLAKAHNAEVKEFKTNLKNASATQLDAHYRRMMNDPAHAIGAANGWKGSDHMRALNRELKARGFGTFQKLAVAVAKESRGGRR